VCELIDPITENWDEQLVKNIFWEMDAKVILATPIRDEFEDFYAWQPEEKGVFSVKSAYKLYVRLRDGTNGSTSGRGEENTFWKNVWKLNCPHKVRQFMWRLAHNSLSLKRNLQRRGTDCDTRCVFL
jgi:hypothetical protein